ncbi:MAG TPA: thiamine phosphate synthase [Chthonomonadales bacterium]|nr:thiamine phosphate synthase [Chthonomonadales bacterium]
MTPKTPDYSVYVITDRRTAGSRDIADVVQAAIRGGATVVQLRLKEVSTRDWLTLGGALRRVTREAGALLIVNDRIDVALALDADGVHVGQDDMPAQVARRLIGPDRILGVSAGSVEQAREAAGAGADYLGVGDVFGTPSKPDAGAPVGLARVAEIVRSVAIPVVGIGGVTPANAASVIAAGAVGVAVISAVIGAVDPEAAARHLRQIVKGESKGGRTCLPVSQ